LKECAKLGSTPDGNRGVFFQRAVNAENHAEAGRETDEVVFILKE
jgi:hypothetical protein